MTISTVTDLVEELRRLRILAPPHLESLNRLPRKAYPPRAFAQYLVRQGWLTTYQINQVCSGHGAELTLGPYVLLERLGAGGMGQVFKARQQRMDRLVALKLIRRDRLGQPKALQRFRREVLAASQLAHPNVVKALDADQVGDTFYFAMEFVEGTDLSRFVRDTAPMSIAQACECIRQAALGLQHIHEHGLVHRDIKPSNLMITRATESQPALVKVLDLGLARQPDTNGGSSEEDLTRDGQLIGTPEYVAPEQAANPHDVDIRADLYSLGCTFFFLLTGRPPFPDGSPLEKFIAHRTQEPPCVRSLRPEVPVDVARVVRTLLAKKAADRYQTPRDLIEALAVASSADTHTGGHTEERSRPSRWRGLRWPGGRWPILAASILGLLVVLGGAWALFPAADARPEVVKPSGRLDLPMLHYVKKETRAESVLATLAANGLPTFQGPWQCIGPFECWGGQLDRVHPPENEIDLSKTYTGKDNRKVSWKDFTLTPGKLTALQPRMDYACVYLLHEFEAAEGASLRLSLGCDDTMKVWLNGELVASKRTGGKAEPDQVLTVLRLRAGKNRLLVKVCNGNGDFAFCISPQWHGQLQTALGDSLERDFPRKPERKDERNGGGHSEKP